MAISKVCVQCSAAFTVSPRRSDEVKYCSLACKTKAGRQTLTCVHCGKLFDRKKSAGKSPVKYCSRDCYSATRKGSTHVVKPDAPRYFITCEWCSKVVRVTETRKDTARFCSRKCQGESPVFAAECSEKQRGEKSWRWAGGTYWSHCGYKRIGQELEHRAVMRCVMVSAVPDHPFLVLVGKDLQLRPEIDVHHIDRNRTNNKPENLLAVTKSAHTQIHHYGTKPKPYECWPSDPPKW